MSKNKPNGFYLVLMFLFWLVLSERFDGQTLAAGAVLCLAIFLVNMDILEINFGYSFKNKRKFLYLLRYFGLLCKEIVLANFHVAKIVLSPTLRISPRTVTFETRLKKPLSRAILANSITLTPGTLTVRLEGSRLTVHCLLATYAEEIQHSRFEALLLKVEEV